MPKQPKKTPNGDKLPQKKDAKNSLKDKMRKHIHDINDVITDADIRDADISNTTTEEDINQKEKELKENARFNEGNAGSDKTKITPWDTLDE
jgi:hypothetical protein